MKDIYPKTGKTLYLNIIWHQHQPLYLDPESDQLQGPWVRTHGTRIIMIWRQYLKSIPIFILPLI
jgi:alpha-amylase/alpha-mannosidase (GH57 family)